MDINEEQVLDEDTGYAADDLLNIEIMNKLEAENKSNVLSDGKFCEGVKKVDGLWECVECGATGLHKSTMKRHAEIHLEHSINVCTNCSKKLRTSEALRRHISY